MSQDDKKQAPTVAPAIINCWVLTGPTASGKTTVGLELARHLNGEIVSLDSMAVYRGMDIGTAKPSAEQNTEIAHHLIDIRSPDEPFSVWEYLQLAHAEVQDIRQRGHEVLFVGGTPMYLKALLRGVFVGPPADWEFRDQVAEEAERTGSTALHQRLAQVDPLTAARLHPNDQRRIIRALEVYKTTGQPISHLQQQFDEGRPASNGRVFVLQWPRAELHRRIEARVDAMFAAGWVDEVRQLLAQHDRLSRTASQAVGYREVLEHLQGKHSLDETRSLVKARTRQFARRQETWFRSLSECQFIPCNESDAPEVIVQRILAADAKN